MLKRILIIIMSLVLLVAPFWPLPEYFFPVVDHSNFVYYGLTCFIIFLIAVILVFLLHKNIHPNSRNKRLVPAACLFCMLGFTAMFALHMGPPKVDPGLLDFIGMEQVRYGMLLVSVILFTSGSLLLVKKAIPKPATRHYLFYTFLIITVLVNTWDNASSYMMGSQLKTWVNAGNNPGDFFLDLNHHINWRAFARITLYVTSAWISAILWQEHIIKAWQAVVLLLFCVTGILFCVLCITGGFGFYFPFMVPAVALAPAYWTGLILLGKSGPESGQQV